MQKRAIIPLLAVLGIAFLFRLVPNQIAIGSPCYATNTSNCRDLNSSCVHPYCYGLGGVQCDLCFKCTKKATVTWTSTRYVSVPAGTNEPGMTVTKPGDACTYRCTGYCQSCGGHEISKVLSGELNSKFEGTGCVGPGTPPE